MTDRSPKEDIEAIKRENLTGRQLRLARRLAQKNGLDARSDLDAVRLLRQAGIEPFSAPQPGDSALNQPAALNTLPVKGKGKDLPGTRISAQEQELNIRLIQEKLVRRRQRRIFASLAKLFVFIALPTIIAGYYYANLATPIFASHSKFVVQKNSAPTSSAGGLLAGSSFATATESISVQEYLQSRPVMIKLDEEYGFRKLFENPDVDAVQRLDTDASNETSYKLYQKRVKLSYDPTEGVIGLEVSTPDPQASFDISNLLHSYAEEHITQMTSRSRNDQIRGAEEAVIKAEENFRGAQERVIELQSEQGIISGETEISMLMGQIGTMEEELRILELDLDELLSNANPNQARVDAKQRQIDRLNARISGLRGQMTDGTDQAASLSRIQSQLQSAQVELAMRQELIQASVQGLEVARLEAESQAIYLNRAVEPQIADDNTYPKVFENTLLSFLVFAGIYLLITLTYSILREQMTT